MTEVKTKPNDYDIADFQVPSKRQPEYLRPESNESIVTSPVGHTDSDSVPEAEHYHRIYFNILDNTLGERSARFGERNCDILSAISSLQYGEDFLNPAKMKPLTDLLCIDSSSQGFINEFSVAKAYIERETVDRKPKELKDIIM